MFLPYHDTTYLKPVNLFIFLNACLNWGMSYKLSNTVITQSAGAVEYTDCISAGEYDSPN